MKTYHIEAPEKPLAVDIEGLGKGIQASRLNAMEVSLGTNPSSNPQLQYLFLKDPEQKVRGGIRYYIEYDYLVLENIWVEKELQTLGYGVRLYTRLEEMARTASRRHILLSSLSSQGALGFWKKMNFVVVGEIPDCPQGQTLFYLQKKLTR